MRYTTFGHRTGLRVSRYALGTVNFGTRWAKGADPAECRRMFEAFATAMINLGKVALEAGPGGHAQGFGVQGRAVQTS